MINLIYACDLYGAIGKDNKLPWNLPEDLERFKHLTSGHTVIMGRKTYESLPMFPKGLPGRRNVVVSNTIDSNEHVEVVRSLTDFIESFPVDQTLWVIGGGEIYQVAVPLVDNVYQTLIDVRINGADTWFKIDDYPQFKLVEIQRIGNFANPNKKCFWFMTYCKDSV